MTSGSGARGYLSAQVNCATPLELIVMLYDAGLRSADAAHEALVTGDIHARRSAMNKLMGIIAELQNTLDTERGGKIAADLDDLYSYLLTRLLAAIADRDPRPVDEVRRILGTLRDAWREIAQQPQAALAGSQP